MYVGEHLETIMGNEISYTACIFDNYRQFTSSYTGSTCSIEDGAFSERLLYDSVIYSCDLCKSENI